MNKINSKADYAKSGRNKTKRPAADINHHHHFKCIKCNSIIDIYNDFFDDTDVPEEIQKQFTVLSKRTIFEGVCNKCKKL